MTTQEPTTGGLPRATGGALPADPDLPGVLVPPAIARPGEGLLAAPAPDPRADPLWRTIREYLPGLASMHVDGLVDRIRRELGHG